MYSSVSQVKTETDNCSENIVILFLFFLQNEDIYTTSINEMNWTELPMHQDLKQIPKLSSVIVAVNQETWF